MSSPTRRIGRDRDLLSLAPDGAEATALPSWAGTRITPGSGQGPGRPHPDDFFQANCGNRSAFAAQVISLSTQARRVFACRALAIHQEAALRSVADRSWKNSQAAAFARSRPR